MIAKPPTDLVYIPRIWPTFVLASAVAVLARVLAIVLGHRGMLLLFAAAAFCTGIVISALLCRRRVGIIPLALPSSALRVRLFRLSVGLCWGAFLLALLLLA